MEIEQMLLRYSGPATILMIVLISFLLLNLTFAKPNRINRRLGVFLTYLVCVGFAIGAARGVSWYIDARIQHFNPRETWWLNTTVPEGYEYLLMESTQDTGRSMIFITAPILTPLVMLFTYAAVAIRRHLFRRPSKP